ncbi:MAG: type III-B CRISPR module RAMP protein Cmr4 [Ignavibacteriaceae bacterium]
MNRYKMLLIETLTNTHVGSGDTHFGIVDKLIQRSPVTLIPVIHSSGIKGALKDHFELIDQFKPKIKTLFGEDGTDKNSFPGRLIFFEANLLTVPLRSSRKVFYHSTSPYVIKEYLSNIQDFTNKAYNTDLINNWLGTFNFNEKTAFYTFDNILHPEIEDFRCDKKGVINKEIKEEIKKLTGIDLEDIALFNNDFFKKICERSLPVIARNRIDEEGQSENLFYEEVLPRKSKLYFILGDENNLLKRDYDDLINVLTDKETIVQFGGNYSVGYGFCKVSEQNLN